MKGFDPCFGFTLICVAFIVCITVEGIVRTIVTRGCSCAEPEEDEEAE